MVTNPFAWEDNFPPVFGHTSISYLKRCPGFAEAKSGSMKAALAVVSMCIKSKRIASLKQEYSNAILLPVITKNKLPQALAAMIGLKIQIAAYVKSSIHRKSLTAIERLLHKPAFCNDCGDCGDFGNCGEIIKGKQYILVDDVVTQGGTIAALRKFVIASGGSVVAVAALTYSIGSKELAPSAQDHLSIADKFNATAINVVLRDYRIANDISELTKSQVRYLLRFKEIVRIINKIRNAIVLI